MDYVYKVSAYEWYQVYRVQTLSGMCYRFTFGPEFLLSTDTSRHNGDSIEGLLETLFWYTIAVMFEGFQRPHDAEMRWPVGWLCADHLYKLHGVGGDS